MYSNGLVAAVGRHQAWFIMWLAFCCTEIITTIECAEYVLGTNQIATSNSYIAASTTSTTAELPWDTEW